MSAFSFPPQYASLMFQSQTNLSVGGKTKMSTMITNCSRPSKQSIRKLTCFIGLVKL